MFKHKYVKPLLILFLLVLVSSAYYTFRGASNNDYLYKIPVLMYHHISEDPDQWSDATISPDKFREDLLYLKALGYEPIHFKDFIDHQEKGTTLPKNPIFITFDDGYLSNYEYAYPILQELNMKATISVIGWSRGRTHHLDGVTKIIDHFSWEEAKEMYDSGLVDIQHHTYDLHMPGDDITYGKGVGRMTNEEETAYRQRFTEDAIKLTELIEDNIGNEVNVFVYPFGVYNDITESILEELGFKVTLTTKDGISDLSEGLFELKRINSPQRMSSPELMSKIIRLQGRRVEIPFSNLDDSNLRIEKLEELLEIK